MDRVRRLVLLLMMCVAALPAGGVGVDVGRCVHAAAGHQSAPGSDHGVHAMSGHHDDPRLASHAGHADADDAGMARTAAPASGDGGDTAGCPLCADDCHCASCGATPALASRLAVSPRRVAARLDAPVPPRRSDTLPSAPFRPPIPL